MNTLDPIERNIVFLIALEYSNEEISKKLYMSKRNIYFYINSIKKKWNVRSRVEIAILFYHKNSIKNFINVEEIDKKGIYSNDTQKGTIH